MNSLELIELSSLNESHFVMQGYKRSLRASRALIMAVLKEPRFISSISLIFFGNNNLIWCPPLPDKNNSSTVQLVLSKKHGEEMYNSQ